MEKINQIGREELCDNGRSLGDNAINAMEMALMVRLP